MLIFAPQIKFVGEKNLTRTWCESWEGSTNENAAATYDPKISDELERLSIERGKLAETWRFVNGLRLNLLLCCARAPLFPSAPSRRGEISAAPRGCSRRGPCRGYRRAARARRAG
jgi:hypothetical protein